MTLDEAKQLLGGEVIDLGGVKVIRTQLLRRVIDITEELLGDIVLMPQQKWPIELQETAKVTK